MPDQTPGSSPEIDALLQEDRRFEPSAAFRAAAHVNDPGIYERAAKDPEGFWAGFARELEWSTPWTTVLEWTPAVRQVVHRRHAERQRQLRGPARSRDAPQQGRAGLGR